MKFDMNCMTGWRTIRNFQYFWHFFLFWIFNILYDQKVHFLDKIIKNSKDMLGLNMRFHLNNMNIFVGQTDFPKLCWPAVKKC